LLKSFWNLSMFDSLRLAALQRENKRLYRAYLLKDSLVASSTAKTSGSHYQARSVDPVGAPFAARAVQRASPPRSIKHTEGILAYVTSGFPTAGNRGLNGKDAPPLTRRAMFHSAHGLIALIMLLLRRHSS